MLREGGVMLFSSLGMPSHAEVRLLRKDRSAARCVLYVEVIEEGQIECQLYGCSIHCIA